ncbi:DUF4150 domain-containing protein [unidentified bacterial endosymbiont]|uniref:DUF4150 domain-containing protein n=1 Tax=unidentified bacterial endosymbiont TaxID=2355 RepID=UPI00209EDBE3|nr:DUF4150 domain-containing protein [unidentified bacterial endosymbiont]
MFMNTTMGGMNTAFPDVCNTPTPAGPVPIPYPNISNGNMANPGTVALKVLVGGMPTLHLNSQIPVSNGDNVGTLGGAVSGMMMGPTRFTQGSTAVLLKGMPATRLTSTTAQNGTSPNGIGVVIIPAQIKVVVMK